MWGTTDPDELQEVWATKLAGTEPVDIRTALDGLSTTHLEFPPTLFEFAAMCREARRVRASLTPKLEPPKPDIDPAMLEQARAMLAPKKDPKKWAKEILALAERGEYHYPYGIHAANVALGLATDEATV